MRRQLLLLLLCALPLTASADDVVKVLATRYQELNALILKRDAKGAEAWVNKNATPTLSYTSKDGRKYDRKGYVIIMKQIGALSSVKSSKLTLGKITRSGDRVVVVVSAQLTATAIIDTRTLTMEDSSETAETWVRKGSDWKLLSVQQTQSNTKLK